MPIQKTKTKTNLITIQRRRRRSMEIHVKPCKSMKIYGNLWESIEIHENPRKSMKIYKNLWKSIKISENQWKSMKSMNMYGIYLFRKKKMGYILYSKNINASHICPPKRNILFEQRKWKSYFLGKYWLRPAKHVSKSLFWWKLEMIPRSFRTFCRKRFSTKPR